MEAVAEAPTAPKSLSIIAPSCSCSAASTCAWSDEGATPSVHASAVSPATTAMTVMGSVVRMDGLSCAKSRKDDPNSEVGTARRAQCSESQRFDRAKVSLNATQQPDEPGYAATRAPQE